MGEQAYATNIVRDIGEIFKPPRRIAVADAVEKSVMIATPGGYAGKWSAAQTPYMVEAMNLISSRKFNSVVFAAPARTGKALDITTPVPTPTGWTTMGDITVGDYVIGDDGFPTQVDFVTAPMHDHKCYEISFAHGDPIVADADHLWRVTKYNDKSMLLSSQTIFETFKTQNGRNKYTVEVGDSMVLPDVGLAAQPYTFGRRLGNGHLRATRHIPQLYLRASYRQRLELLQGLMDSAGDADRRTGSCSFSSSNEKLVDGVGELILTLGMRVATRSKRTVRTCEGETTHTVSFHTYNHTKVFCSPEKLRRLQPVNRRGMLRVSCRQIINVVEVESRPVKCIRVKNSSHLFLAGRSMIPTHNTQGLIDGGIGYIITCDPSDILVVHMTEEAARRYSRLRIKRMLNNSPDLKAKMSPMNHDDNVMAKYFRNGTALILAYPSPTQLSAQDYKYVFMSDYDRMPDDTGEGDVYSLAMKRTQTFMSGGMAVAESSPGRDFTDTSWKPKSIHEAPPVGGILGLYNDGDRRLWFWNCPECDDPFPCTPGLGLFNLPEQGELVAEIRKHGAKVVSERHNSIVCPNCGSEIKHESKNRMNLEGFWKTESDRPNSMASFWLGGVAAKFQTWQSLLEKEFIALLHYANTGEETKLKATRNTDQCLPYMPVGAAQKMSADELEMRAEDLPKRVVPTGVRFLIAAVDVQAHKFVVQVQGFGVDLESWIIDRFDIAISERESHGEPAILDPAAYKEDWDMLVDRVILQRYPLDGVGDRTMGIIVTTCDSGGKEGVTENAYSFWKRMKGIGADSRFHLIKGERPRPTANKPMVSRTTPDKTSSAARKAKVTGELPLWLLNTTTLKDAVAANLKRTADGTDRIHFPDWLSSWFYAEIVAETRTEKGWENVGKARNETFDLLGYAKAGILIKLDAYWKKGINWETPPAWADVWDNNSEVSSTDTPKVSRETPQKSRRVRMRVRR